MTIYTKWPHPTEFCSHRFRGLDLICGESWCILSNKIGLDCILTTKWGREPCIVGYKPGNVHAVFVESGLCPIRGSKIVKKTCGAPAFKREQHRKKCAEWNKRNAHSFKANYLQKKPVPESPTTQVKSRLKTELPLQHVQGVIGLQHLIIIECVAQLLVGRFQDVIDYEGCCYL